MAENEELEIVSVDDQIEQLKQQLEEITMNYLELKIKMEQIEEDLQLQQIKNDLQDVQVISSLDKSKEVSAYAEENRSFIQSILKRKNK